MPNKTISILSYVATALLVCYLGLVTATVSFAAWRTDLASAMRDTESDIRALEGEYYAMIDSVSATHPSTLGLVQPASVTYAAMNVPGGISRR